MTSTIAKIYVGTYTRDEGWVNGQGKGVYTLDFDLEKVELSVVDVIEVGVSPIYINGTKTHLYIASQFKNDERKTGCLTAVSIASDGKLSIINSYDTNGEPVHVALHTPEYDFVTAACYQGGNVNLFPISETGALSERAEIHVYEGGIMHSSLWIPGTKYVFAADLGNDRVMQYILDPVAKKISPNPIAAGISRPKGSGPRHMAVHPNGKIVYVGSEYGNTIGVYELDRETGTLGSSPIQEISSLPADFQGVSTQGDLRVSADGNFVIASNRGNDSNIVTSFKVDLATGKLQVVSLESSRGKVPRGTLLIEDFLLVANQDSNTIEIFKIDQTTGEIVHTGKNVECPTPVEMFTTY